jgi:zinc D-Ala-D-Ala carboxypeptidase
MLITPNFSTSEVQCHCGCGENEMDDEFMRMLQQLREEAGFAFRLSSARRCLNHNSSVSSNKTKAGIHTFGKAVDILVGSVNTTKTLKLIKQAQDIGFTGLGLALKGDRKKRFIHLDNRGTDFSLPAVWTY